MNDKWICKIIDLFRPEHSLQFSCEKSTPVPVVRSAKKPSVSAKALFWAAVSIAAGLAIGQLR